ncbi:MAG: M28 family peptidase [Gemmatimonadaceae bacterium]|jgi:hypothetical protein|nr:M28 family peptidase [Gemmatimonadaceae bacterium]
MRAVHSRTAVAVLALLPAFAAFAQPRASAPAATPSAALPLKHAPKPTTRAISAADLMTRLYIFADDSMQGRDTGTPGNLRGLAYIASQIKALGLEPAGDNGTYFQSVPMVRRAFDPAATLMAGSTALKFGDDVIPVQFNPSMPSLAGAGVIYAGPEAAGLTEAQTKGKVLLFSRRPSGNALANPAIGGAAAVFVAGLEELGAQMRAFATRPSISMAGAGARGVQGPSAFYVSKAGATALMGGKSIDSLAVGTAGATLTNDLRPVESALDVRNVVGIIRGSDAALRNSYVAIGAHNDHVGIAPRAVDHDSLKAFNDAMWALRGKGEKPFNAAMREQIRVNLDSARAGRPARMDSIYNGADDDGSGSMGVLEIAEAIAKAPQKPKRSLLFVWHAGEERGLLGALHYTDQPTVPRDSIVAQLNIDMIGRGRAADQPLGGPTYVGLVGSRRLSTELGDLIETINGERRDRMVLDYALDANGHPENIYCRSDHFAYARYGIPVAFFYTGAHGDYHQLTDEPQYIDYPHYVTITQFIHDIALRVGNLDHRPVVDKPKPDPKGRCQQ